MFCPPRCPYRDCKAHASARAGFFTRHGYYKPKCRPRPVPRYLCRECGRTFSRQTFRADHRDHRPDLNGRLLRYLASGIGLRQSSRNLGLSLRCTELKFRKLARHVRRLNLNLRGPLPPGSSLQLDEFETYETRRLSRPLSVPMLIEKRTRYVIWAESAPIRPRGRKTPSRERAVRADERRFGPRKDLSARAVGRTLRRGADLGQELGRVLVETDEKVGYPRQLRLAFGEARVDHATTSSRVERTTWNPLFAINHTEEMLRDLTGRLRRDSWLVSKKRRYLDLGLQVWMAYRNLVRRRFNRDEASPAEMLGFLPRRLTWNELVSWRQDWGGRSLHPLSRRGRPIDSRAGS